MVTDSARITRRAVGLLGDGSLLARDAKAPRYQGRRAGAKLPDGSRLRVRSCG